jgi:uncharacterized membrane protein YdjX (TVP38/TMEM64 family)
MESLYGLLQMILDAIGTAHPVMLFLALALLPLVGVPTSVLWIAAGVRLGTLSAFALCAVALLVNFTAGYWLARCALRLPVIRWLERRGWRIPQVPASDETLAILILRVTPGIPLCVQNYLLGLARVKFGRYLLLSMPAQAAYALAFVWFGDSLASNAVWHLLLALAALAGVSLLISLLRRRLNRCAPGAALSPHIRSDHDRGESTTFSRTRADSLEHGHSGPQ